MDKLLQNIKISHKLIGSYSILIVLVIVLGVFSFSSMLKLKGTFTDYRNVARESLMLADMSQLLGNARRAVFKYRISSTPQTQQVVFNSIDSLATSSDRIDEVVKNEEHAQILRGLQTPVRDYNTLFQSAVQLQGLRNTAVEELDTIGPKIRKIITQIAESAFRDQDPEAAYYAGRVQEKFMLGRYYARSYLLQNKAEDSARALKDIDSAAREVETLLNSLENPTRRQLAKSFSSGLAQYKAKFQEISSIIAQRNEKYAQMDKLGPEIFDTYTGLFKENENIQNTLGPAASKTISTVATSSVIISVIIAIIAIIVAIIIIPMIVNALNNVIDIMTKMREGDYTVRIKGIERGDEIGQMSRAIRQFRENAKESYLLKRMVDDMPRNVMTVDVNDNLKVNYMNKQSVIDLKGLEDHLPIKADEILGQSIDIFHANPEHQRRLLGDPNNLPHHAKIKVGPETMLLMISAIKDMNNKYVGAMLNWEFATAKESMGQNVEGVVSVMSNAVTELEATAQSMSSMATETRRQAQTVTDAAKNASQNVSTVAASTEELTASISEITKQISESTRLTGQVKEKTTSTNETVGTLKEAADKIGEVINLINDIAEQTNLLALNATIEAARAGDAGKGFAVVASEVKNLANETAKATEEISKQILEIQSVTDTAVVSIEGITESIVQLDSLSSTISAAIEEQSAATQEIAQSVEQAASGTREVTSNIVTVSDAAEETGDSAEQVLLTAKELGKQSENLKVQVSTYFDD